MYARKLYLPGIFLTAVNLSGKTRLLPNLPTRTKTSFSITTLTLLDKFEDQIILLLRLHGDEVHAVLAAHVAAV